MHIHEEKLEHSYMEQRTEIEFDEAQESWLSII